MRGAPGGPRRVPRAAEPAPPPGQTSSERLIADKTATILQTEPCPPDFFSSLLKRFLVINETQVPFVIGDNPVVSTNWFGRTRHPGRMAGMPRSGLQLIMPLSPWAALMMHDSNVYAADSEHNVIRIRQTNEATTLNTLQWLNAFKNVYVPPDLGEPALQAFMSVPRQEGELSKLTRMEQVGKGVFRDSNRDEFSAPPDGATEEIIRLSSIPLARDVRLQAVHIRRNPVFHDDGSLASPRRDPAWAKLVGEFADEVQAGRAKMSDFWDFVVRHRLEPDIGSWLGRAERQGR